MKRSLRAWAKAKRDAMEERDWQKRSEIIRKHIRGWETYLNANIVAAFSPFGREVDIWPLIKEILGKNKFLLLPRVNPDGTLALCPVKNRNQIKPGYKGILEPDTDPVDFLKILPDLILIPGLAFDRTGYRLGFGKGFYDKLLGAIPAAAAVVKLGVAFDWQVVDKIPVEEHDAAVDFLATEEGIADCRNLKKTGLIPE